MPKNTDPKIKKQRPLPKSWPARLILNFHPSWFAVVMGTGIISILLHTTPHKFPGEAIIGTVFYVANICLIVLFTLLSAARYSIFPWAFERMLRHEGQSLFLGTIPMGLATIVNATVLIAVPAYGQWARDLAWVLWWIDVFLTLLSTFGIPMIMFHMHNHTLEGMTGAWLLPIVPAVVAAASGGLVASVLPPAHAVITIIVSYVLWGVGMSLSIFVMVLYFHRLCVHHLPAPEIIVSAYLPLGPCGQGAYGLIQLAQAGQSKLNATGLPNAGDTVLVESVIVALIIWGLGLWWLVHGTVAVLLCMRSAKFKPNMGWWGFIFPLGVFIAATIKLGDVLPSAFFAYLSIVFLGALFIMYIMVALFTLMGVWTGELLKAPCMSDLSLHASVKDNGLPALDELASSNHVSNSAL